MLLNSAAEVHPDIDTVPPLMRAVLSQHKGTVQLLLAANANPWQSVPIGALIDLSWREPVCPCQVAAAQGPTGECSDLINAAPELFSTLAVNQATKSFRPTITVPTERATMLLARVVADYQLNNGPHRPRLGHESLRWRKILAGLAIPSKRCRRAGPKVKSAHPYCDTILQEVD